MNVKKANNRALVLYGAVFRIRILLSSSKKSRKNHDSYCFVTSFDFLSLNNYVNVRYLQKVVSKKTERKKKFSVGVLKVNDENSRIRIRIH